MDVHLQRVLGGRYVVQVMLNILDKQFDDVELAIDGGDEFATALMIVWELLFEDSLGHLDGLLDASVLLNEVHALTHEDLVELLGVVDHLHQLHHLLKPGD